MLSRERTWIGLLLCPAVAAKVVNLSVVLCARNDDHAGDFLDRLRWSLFSIALGLCRHRDMLISEIIIVEWRPPEDRPRLAELLPKWYLSSNYNQDFDCQAETMPPVRIIPVPDEVAEAEFPSASPGEAGGKRIWQWQCKAVGLRRASGEFLLATNADNLWSPKLFRFLSAAHHLRADSFYVTHTVEMEGPLRWLHSEGYPFFQVYDEVFSGKRHWYATLYSHLTRLKARYPVIADGASQELCEHALALPVDFRIEEFKDWWAQYDLLYGVRLGVSDPLSDPGKPGCKGRFENLFDSQPGDFILAPREAWHRIAGAPMLPQNMYVDYLVVCRLASMYRQVVLSHPCFLYHQAHANVTQRRELGAAESELGGHNIWQRCCDPFKPFESERGYNSSDWGLASRRLPESILQYQPTRFLGDYVVSHRA